MIRPSTRLLLLSVAAGATSCAYFNGLYNANRLMGDAVKAEREGRSGEARSLWSQAAVKAESVAVRHPKSRYRDDALLLWGRALREVESCPRAVTPLRMAVDLSSDEALRREARILLGQCLVLLRRPDSALSVLGPLVSGADTLSGSSVRLWLGRAQLLKGDHAAAARNLELAPRERAAFDLAIAYGRMDRADDASAVLRERAAGPFAEGAWTEALDSLGGLSAERAAEVVDRLVAPRDVTDGQRGRLLLADGRRWARAGRADQARRRFLQAAEAAPDSLEGSTARVELAMAELRETRDLSRLGELEAALAQATARGGEAARLGGPALQLLRRTGRLLADTALERADLVLFVLAEALRDSVEAKPVAAALFRRLQERFPSSIVAPKALLAAAALDGAPPDAVRSLLESRYADSPYTLALTGGGDAAFRALEDSLRILLAEARKMVTEEEGEGPARVRERRR